MGLVWFFWMSHLAKVHLNGACRKNDLQLLLELTKYDLHEMFADLSVVLNLQAPWTEARELFKYLFVFIYLFFDKYRVRLSLKLLT